MCCVGADSKQHGVSGGRQALFVFRVYRGQLSQLQQNQADVVQGALTTQPNCNLVFQSHSIPVIWSKRKADARQDATAPTTEPQVLDPQSDACLPYASHLL